MPMKTILLLVTLVSVSCTLEFSNLTGTEDIEIKEYGTTAAKDIRAIGRSYAHNLMNNQYFTDYIDDAYTMVMVNDEFEVDGVKEYAQKYKSHIGMVGIGIILSVFLFIGFCCTPCCMCLCNNSQKQGDSMGCWRMVWGTILVLLLAANVAGILIAIVSGQQILTLNSDTNATIDTLGDGVVDYLSATNQQIETLKDNQFEVFIDALKPLVDTAINDTVDQIKADTDLSGAVTQITEALDNLDSTLDTALTTIQSIEDDITSLTTNIGTINTNLATCKSALDDCGTNCDSIDTAQFDTQFDTAELSADSVTSIKTSITEMETFSGKTLSEWSTYVQDQWDDLGNFVWNATADARTAYSEMISNATTDFKAVLSEDVQTQLTDLMDTIGTFQEQGKGNLSETLDYLKSSMMLQDAETDFVDEDIQEFVKYGLFAVFVFVCLLVVLLLLTVVIGLVSTILGCCKVSDDVPTTERKSGCCGCLLMGTSYCAVILCAIATFSAALMLTVVMMEEGVCKQYDDGKLLTKLNDLGATFDVDLDISKLLEENLNLTDVENITSQTLMTDCGDGKTIVTVLGITNETEMAGISVAYLKEQLDEAIDSFDIDDTLGSLDIGFDIMDDSAKAELEANKDALTDEFDYDTVKSYLTDTDMTSGDLNLTTAIASITALKDDVVTDTSTQSELADCITGLEEIQTLTAADGTIETTKSSLVDSLTSMETTANSASTEITSFIDGIDTVSTTISGDYATNMVTPNVENVISSARGYAVDFIDWLFGQFQTTIGSCQPIAAVYETLMKYTCDGIFIHLTLLYCSLSLIGISLLFYMCVARCLARYFIKYDKLHPDDEGTGNGWSKDHSLVPMSQNNNRVSPYPGNYSPYSQTKL